ncbi:MAG: nitrous oxide reductase accessory protein NosL [Hoeflea sp.]|uniref:nitrous oxide reductase accessory protein NosL n=1 Tax=Hoeflea sp. TaxID=1940281 RepID=UPI0027300892|nr:nitrous oxide reductase accessory protein NosL [Hoeflea sp.]MDP2122120.1 nitrous oxide reductase accessory protein NosL [Hoeflea sp.]MDP3527295.1 nitrous oxide reductase accessory protein NosL [Hoeflea sp.]
MKRLTTLAAIVAAAISLAACSEQQSSAEVPLPVALSEEAVGHYCNMTILEHTGPKAQIHLANNPHPLWFSQVRDGIAFIRSPEETYEAVVVYVNDMGKASDWDFPGFETWIDAREAWFVIGSRKTGGMGTPEVIPFGTEQTASGFADENGGLVVRLAEIPDAYVLGPNGLDEDKDDPVTGALQ